MDLKPLAIRSGAACGGVAGAGHDGLEIETRWIAQDVGDVAPPNYEIARAPLTTKAPMNLAQLSRPTNGWPLGLYRLELWHAGTAFHTVYFAIEDVEAERE